MDPAGDDSSTDRRRVPVPMTVRAVEAAEVLDSRGKPTLAVSMMLVDGTQVKAGVPSGASTGSREAVELRDGDRERFGGHGVRNAVASVNGEISAALSGRTFADLAQLDNALIDLDGTEMKSRLGANAIVGVSMAGARAMAHVADLPLWRFLNPPKVTPRLPVPHFNVVNGGVHAPNNLDFQEFMVAPIGAPSLAEAVRAGAEVYTELRSLLAGRGLATGLGDEGGFAPQIDRPEEVLICWFGPSTMPATAWDATASPSPWIPPPASSTETASTRWREKNCSSGDMIDRYEEIVSAFPVWSVEDGLAEDDWEGWVRLTERLGHRVQLVGDDILVTNPSIISQAIGRRVGNAALIKVNQVGTVTETLSAMAVCREAGWGQMVSHRSGETEDSFIADLAVGSGCGQLKSGAPARGERVAKYNRLIEIERADAPPFGLSA